MGKGRGQVSACAPADLSIPAGSAVLQEAALIASGLSVVTRFSFENADTTVPPYVQACFQRTCARVWTAGVSPWRTNGSTGARYLTAIPTELGNSRVGNHALVTLLLRSKLHFMVWQEARSDRRR
jgi:hypothetical protein